MASLVHRSWQKPGSREEIVSVGQTGECDGSTGPQKLSKSRI